MDVRPGGFGNNWQFQKLIRHFVMEADTFTASALPGAGAVVFFALE
jgi:hypothetical protein